MSPVALPILVPKMQWQHYSCHGCGDCCRDFSVQLRRDDLEKLESQGWESLLGEPVVEYFRGQPYLKRRQDGSCIFLMEDGLCRIHAEHGFSEKPIACQVFPFNLAPGEHGIRVGVNFLCSSVLDNKGAQLSTHKGDLRRFADSIPEIAAPAPDAELATGTGVASERERSAVLRLFDEWLCRSDVPVATRFEGFAFVAQSLGNARLENVREERFVELLRTLTSVLPQELELQPVETPTSRQEALLRQAAFTRTEDPRIDPARGRFRTTLSQLTRSRRIRRGRGKTPRLSSALPSGVAFNAVAGVGPFADSPDAEAIDELGVRYMRASLHGARTFGSAYYGWSIVDGLQVLALNVACAAWIARLCSAAEGRPTVVLEDLKRGIGRVDRHVGRAPWLGSSIERLRLRYFRLDDGLRRIARASW